MRELIGFLGIFGSMGLGPRDGMRGGLLVTDMEGKPEEIQVAETVKANALQTALYGQTLERYVIADLLSEGLLSSLRTQPQLVLANRSECLRAEGLTPLFQISRFDRSRDVISNESTVLDAVGAEPSLFLTGQPGLSHTTLHWASGVVAQAQQDFDPMEIFTRLEDAFRTLAQHDERFQ